MVRSAQNVHLPCIKISTITKLTKMSFDLGLVTQEYHWVCPNRFLTLRYVWFEPYTYLALTLTPSPNDWNEIPDDPCHQGFLSSASKIIFEPMVRSAQTVHLSCLKISDISKLTETSCHFILVTLEYHRVRQKWFLSLWHVWGKLCTYLAPTLTPSPNGPKRDSRWPTSPRSSTGPSKMISEPMVHSA
jgi:hypothetical protein